MDLVLPDREGTELCHLIREANPSAQVVLITGHRAELEPRIERLRADGLTSICYKPFDVPVLLVTLKQLIEGEAG